jgi:signal transduction histidine kinase
MSMEDAFALDEQFWAVSEQLSDGLAEIPDPAMALKFGLGLVLSALGRPGGALFVPRFCEKLPEDWTFSNPPPAWLPDPGRVEELRRVQEMVLHSGQPAPACAPLEMAGAFPLRLGEQTTGVLLVHGPAIPAADFPRWVALLRPLARAIRLHGAAGGSIPNGPSYRDLLRSRNTLRAMFDSLPISIYIIDNAYNLAAVNTSRAGRAGEHPNQLVGRKCYEKFYQREGPCPSCRAAETFGSGQNTLRLARDWLDNEKFNEWEISTFPIYDENDVVMQTVVIEQDVTEKRNLEANLIQSEKLAAVGQLAAGVAHEINNPLTAIIANAQLLHRGIDPSDQDLIDSINLIEMAGTRAAQVVRNLLGIARKEKYEFEPVDMNQTVRNALSLVHHELVGRPIQVHLELAEDLPPLMASQDHLQGVWINLILNAIDAMDKADGQLSIITGFSQGVFQVAISDNGKGIAPDHLARLFEPFFTTKAAGRGTGLGLSVCMRVVRHHGGDIRVESQPGKWTRFNVTLPGPR